MSQQAEREQGENTDEGKSVKDCFVDHVDNPVLEAQSNAQSSSCADLTVPRSGVLSEDMQDVKKDIVNKKINEEQQSISELEEKLKEVNEVNENQKKIISKLEEKLKEVNEVNENQKKRISKLNEKLNELNEVNEVNENQKKRISELEEKLNEAGRNTRKDLWLYGLQEQEGENLKQRVIAICSAVVPEAAGDFPLHIDTVQRVGKKNEGKVRPVIIRFTEKSTKELLLTTSKSSEFHRSSSLKFAEVLTAQDIETRNRRWPEVEAARKQGKIAYFAGATVIIDGKEISE